MTQFSVVIPTYQRPDDLARCLEQLKPGAQTLSFERYEVTVTDDEGEGSATQALVREQYPWAKWVPGPGQGPAANRNRGADYAEGEWLVFTDDDCVPKPGWLEAYAETGSKSPSLDVMEGVTLPDGPRESLAWQAPINTEGGRLWSCNLAVRSDCFSTLGGFDTDYPFALEDLDFRARVFNSEVEWEFEPRAAVVHPWVERTTLELFRRQVKEAKGWRVFARKHPAYIREFRLGYLIAEAKQIWEDFTETNFRMRGVVPYLGLSTGRTIKRIIIIFYSRKFKDIS
ncbi:glycosyltransferase family 2 protein [Salinibacter ruber]|uniref:glycosyltransferase family 2 protein n=1 Tax=Salinibacter ruber TaxID=146919 RepID=UPI0021687432|nr:glycosyltransferase family 2 protein [Salinibacter ruber]MCS4185186.1 GT2 family glycosyltransferase [Salinibacter ruber]